MEQVAVEEYDKLRKENLELKNENQKLKELIHRIKNTIGEKQS